MCLTTKFSHGTFLAQTISKNCKPCFLPGEVKKDKIMEKEVEGIEEALKTLEAHCVEWAILIKTVSSVREKGIVFFDRRFCRVAYYDEVHDLLSIH